MKSETDAQFDEMIPPDSMNFVGAGDFLSVGREFREIFVQTGGLKSCHSVLDVGCGLGRMAIPLTNYIQHPGQYWGIDIVKAGIDWCNSQIASRFNHFHFLHTDVYNQHYNPGGRIPARIYRFPFEADTFDFIFLTSVFTHMSLKDLTNYLREITRVMKSGGRCLSTFFLLNRESEELMLTPKSALSFKYQLNGCFTVNPNDPEVGIAYSEIDLMQVMHQAGLCLSRPIEYGTWCGREAGLTFQDVLVLKMADEG